MSGSFPPSGEGGPPQEPAGEHRIALGRAVVLIAVAVALGVYLLGVASRPPVQPTAQVTPATTTTSTTAPGHHQTTTTTTVARGTVTVLVANGTSTPGVAGAYTSELQGDGWNTQRATNTTSPVSSSAVYYGPGEQAAANDIASTVGVASSAVQPLTTSAPVASTSGVDVLVVVGPDLAANAPTTTTTAG